MSIFVGALLASQENSGLVEIAVCDLYGTGMDLPSTDLTKRGIWNNWSVEQGGGGLSVHRQDFEKALKLVRGIVGKNHIQVRWENRTLDLDETGRKIQDRMTDLSDSAYATRVLCWIVLRRSEDLRHQLLDVYIQDIEKDGQAKLLYPPKPNETITPLLFDSSGQGFDFPYRLQLPDNASGIAYTAKGLNQRITIDLDKLGVPKEALQKAKYLALKYSGVSGAYVDAGHVLYSNVAHMDKLVDLGFK